MHLTAAYLHRRRLPAGCDLAIGDGRWRIYAHGQDGAWIDVDGRRTELPRDRVAVIPPVRFRLRSRASVVHLNLDLAVTGLPVPNGPSILPDEHAVTAALSELRRGPFPRRLLGPRTMAAAHLLLARYLLLVLEEDPRTAADPPLLAAALSAMRGDPCRSWSNAELAARCAMSRGGFLAAFARHHGRTPQRWLMDQRLAMAAEMLDDDRLGLEDIARRTGFANRSHLSNRFRALHGQSPAQWRRRSPG